MLNFVLFFSHDIAECNSKNHYNHDKFAKVITEIDVPYLFIRQGVYKA